MTILQVGDARWETATRPAPPALAPHVRRMLGYDERTATPSHRDELPGSSVVVIVELGPPLRVGETGGRQQGGFVAGHVLGPTPTAHDGWQRGLQLDLSPTAARRLLGVPMSTLTGHVVSLADLAKGDDRHLAEILAELPDWTRRFDHLEAWLTRRMAEGPRPDRRVVIAMEAIAQSGGNVDISALRSRLEVSEKHLVSLFRNHVGIPPKRFGRLMRFERLQAALREGRRSSWAELALSLGYFDQAHMNRDVRAFARLTPTELEVHLGGRGVAG